MDIHDPDVHFDQFCVLQGLQRAQQNRTVGTENTSRHSHLEPGLGNLYVDL
jgi:hypothetical protein